MTFVRIGYVLAKFPVISETFILNEIVELIKQGHEVFIFSLIHSKNKIIHKQIIKYGLLKKTYYPSRLYLDVVLDLFDIKTLKSLKYNERKLLRKISGIALANNIYKKAKKLNLDVIHAHFNSLQTFVAMILSKQLNIPFTFTTHAFDIFINPDKKALQERINNSKYTITISNFNVKYIRNLVKINKEKLKVIHASPPIYDLKKIKSKICENRLISVGRLVEKKGLIYALKAVKELKEKFPKIEYLIIGGGPQKSKLEHYIKSNNLSNNVKIIGPLAHKNTLKLINSSSIFILPCIKAKNGDMDGIPVSIMEAMYLKKPVISTFLSGIPELITNNKEGLLVKPKSIKQLTEAMRKLLKNRDLRYKLGLNAYRKVNKEFDIRKEVNKLIGLWEK